MFASQATKDPIIVSPYKPPTGAALNLFAYLNPILSSRPLKAPLYEVKGLLCPPMGHSDQSGRLLARSVHRNAPMGAMSASRRPLSPFGGRLTAVASANRLTASDSIASHSPQAPPGAGYTPSGPHAPSMTRFINFLTKKGKKTKANFIFQKALSKLLDLILTERPIRSSTTDRLAIAAKRSLKPIAGVAPIGAIAQRAHQPLDEWPLQEHSPFGGHKSGPHAPLGGSPRRGNAPLGATYGGGLDRLTASTLFEEALSNLKPSFEVKKVRVAGSTYQVPSLISPKRQENLAINWLLQSCRERRKKTKTLSFEDCLGIEIFEAYKKQGSARTKRNELHKIAELNRAFAHYRWW